MADIVEELVPKLTGAFMHGLDQSETISRLYARVRDGTATYKEANAFAIEAGELLGEVFKANVKASDLPNGRMYYNIASRVMNETLGLDYKMISQYTKDVQTALNKTANIGLGVFVPELNQSRVDGIVDRLSEAENFDEIKWILGEPLVNFSQSIVDDSIKGNAELHKEVGLSPIITRTVVNKCCKWCQALAGTYEYGDEPRDFYKRHENCRCTILYDPKTGKKQNAWTKRWI